MTNKADMIIDNQGFLAIGRAGVFKPSFCPYASSNMTIRCGDWCPQFGEPVPSSINKPGQLDLHCTDTRLEGLLQDQRNKEA